MFEDIDKDFFGDLEELEETEPEETKPVEKDSTPSKKKSKKQQSGVVFTYIGGGAHSPNSIEYMGVLKCTKGVPVKVVDELLIAKLEGNPNFVKGKAAPELLREREEKQKEKERIVTQQDQEIEKTFNRRHK